MGEDKKATDPTDSAEPEYVRKILFPIIIFMSLSLGAYWISIKSPLQFDDFTVIRNISPDNPFNRCDTPRRIIPNVSFALNHVIHQKSTSGYHVVNIFIHTIAGLGLFMLVLQLPINEDRRQRLAWAAGLTFLLHPLATHSVTYITQRYSSMAGMFALWSLAYYARGRRLNCWRCLAISGTLGVLAVLCKEYVAGLILLAITLDVFLFSSTETKSFSKKMKGAVKRSLVLLPATLLFLLIYFYVGRSQNPTVTPAVITKQTIEHGFADWSGKTVNRSNYMRTQWKIIPGTYFRLLAVPLGLSVDHPYTLSPSWTDGKAWAGAVLLAIILGSACVFYRRWPVPAFGIVLIFLTLAPTSTVVPNTEFVAEQRLYLAIAGFALIIGSIISQLSERRFRVVLWVYLIVLASLTILRNDMWNSRLELWQDAAQKNPKSARAFNAIGSLYMREGRFAEAEEQFRKALEVAPDYLPAIYSLPFSLFSQGKYDACISPFIWRLRRDPENMDIISTLGQAFLLKGDLSRARTTASQALKLEPGHVMASIIMMEVELKSDNSNAAEAIGNALLKRQLAPHEEKRVRKLMVTIRNAKPAQPPVPPKTPEPQPVPAP